ncbi:MAG TPA: NAD(P)H-hydrate dehydratase [Candidatus Limnocylindria bacterium]|nr:NAD(P)H-hydrate dehydratase [Candidatus Limnocylindria bacterium]
MAIAGIGQRWVAERLPERPARAHKGTFGSVLVVAGSREYAGAALLAGLGAARGGAGLVTVATSESVGTALLGQIPELTMMLLDEEAPGLLAPGGWRRVASEARRFDAVVVGPGIGRLAATLRRVRGFIAGLEQPVVVDADALNALAEQDGWWRRAPERLVLTPHPGEFARLTRRAAGDPLPDDDEARAAAVREAAVRWRRVVVLKGANTVVADADGSLRRAQIATPSLATAGSGDVLAGIAGAFLAGGLEPFTAACCAVAVHGAAGLLAEERIGRAGVMARDIAGLVPAAMEQLRGDRGR